MTIPSITALPTPPSTASPGDFDTKADAFLGAFPTLRSEINSVSVAMDALGVGMESAALGGATAMAYVFSTTTTDADPGAGKIRFSSATQNASTVLRMDLADKNGADLTALLDAFDDSTSTVKGYLRVQKSSDGTKFILFSITSLASPSGYRNVTVSPLIYSGASPFANDDPVTVFFVPNGDKGATGNTGATGSAGSNGSNGTNGTNGLTAGYGMGLTYNSTTVLDIAAGVTMDSTNAVNITGTAFSKSTAGSWAAGSGGNGMGTGLTIANSTWYHVFAIINNGSYDVYFDTSVSAANKPASTTYFKRIGSFLTNGSAQIVQFHQAGQVIHWNTQVVEVNGGPPSSATLLTLTVPPGVAVRPLLSALYYDGSVGNNYQAWSPGAGSTAKNEMLITSQISNVYANATCDTIVTNTSKQIYHQTNGANSPNLLLYSMGWIDPSLAPA